MTSDKVLYVAVHGGAGQHGRASEAQVKGAMKRACSEALRIASERPSASALFIVERAITVLEDDECLNAGYGSNLTLEGTVECDAAIMDGRTSDFGSVGAVSGVRNPIKLANAVLEHARVPDRLGRIRPLTLVSAGAHAFAQRHGVETADAVRMVAPRAMQDWQRWTKWYEAASADDLGLGAVATVHPQDAMQDTVGAVVWDSDGNLAAGVSSGGLLLKYSGRIGEHLERDVGLNNHKTGGLGWLAASQSGAGEHITRVALARTIADVLRPRQDNTENDVHDLLTRTLSTSFHDLIVARGDIHPNAGVLLMTKEAQEAGHVIPRLWCAFTTESMAVAYTNSGTFTVKAKILRRPKTQPVFATNSSPLYIAALPLHE